MIPLSALLILYLIILAIIAFFALVTIIHLTKYAATNLTTFIATFIYLAGTVIILAFSWDALSSIDWSATVELFDTSPSSF